VIGTPRQEKQPATTDVVEVAPDIIRMQLPIQFTGLGHVNMYGLLDDRGLAVVDPGMPGRGSWQAIEDRLKRAGFRLRDVHTVVVTHSHPDHFGGAQRIADETGARLITHADFVVPWQQPLPDVIDVDDDPDAPDGDPAGVARDVPRPIRFRPPHKVRAMVALSKVLPFKFFRPPKPTVRLAHGETVTLASREWRAVHTPGHTADHLCLHDPETRTLLVGDHVLPTITPHVGGFGAGADPDPLAMYLAALDHVAALPDVEVALPAHGLPFGDVAARAEAIKEHHFERLEKLVEVGSAIGTASVKTFSEHLFAKRNWGMMASSETFAHLEHLRRAHRARRYLRDGDLVYAIAESGS
jgi:glyoxylase-like metal-dependent hydrolase (beta-lactamase superfamily II)